MASPLLKAANLVADSVSMSINSISRRGYSAAAAAAVYQIQGGSGVPSAVRGRSGVVNKKVGAGEEATADSNSWVPDPVTGYYRPANRAADVDAAELRRVLLSQKFPKH